MIRIFIGTNSYIHQKAEKVVKYSILKHTSAEVDVQFINPGWLIGPTGFTTHRYLIPEMCNYAGYAIYMDVDMLILGDVLELWNYQKPGKWCTTKWTPKQVNDDVSVIDCSAFKDLPKSTTLENDKKNKPKKYRKERMRKMIGKRYSQNIPSSWNSIDRLNEDTNLLHFSRLGRQPWHPNPNIEYKPHNDPAAANLFFEYLNEAEAHGY